MARKLAHGDHDLRHQRGKIGDGIDGMTTQSYGSGSYLSPTATATDGSGVGFFLNAPATAITLTATPVAIGRVSARTSIFVRPGALSLVWASPTP